jgi:hypothetical protein
MRISGRGYIKIDTKRSWCERINWIEVALSKTQWRAFVNTKTNLFTGSNTLQEKSYKAPPVNDILDGSIQ